MATLKVIEYTDIGTGSDHTASSWKFSKDYEGTIIIDESLNDTVNVKKWSSKLPKLQEDLLPGEVLGKAYYTELEELYGHVQITVGRSKSQWVTLGPVTQRAQRVPMTTSIIEEGGDKDAIREWSDSTKLEWGVDIIRDDDETVLRPNVEEYFRQFDPDNDPTVEDWDNDLIGGVENEHLNVDPPRPNLGDPDVEDIPTDTRTDAEKIEEYKTRYSVLDNINLVDPNKHYNITSLRQELKVAQDHLANPDAAPEGTNWEEEKTRLENEIQNYETSLNTYNTNMEEYKTKLQNMGEKELETYREYLTLLEKEDTTTDIAKRKELLPPKKEPEVTPPVENTVENNVETKQEEVVPPTTEESVQEETIVEETVTPATPKVKTIKFNSNGGTGTMEDITVELPETGTKAWTVVENKYQAPENKQFKTWAEDAEGTKEKAVGSTIDFGNEGEYTLYAIWEDKPTSPDTTPKTEEVVTEPVAETTETTTDEVTTTTTTNYSGFKMASAPIEEAPAITPSFSEPEPEVQEEQLPIDETKFTNLDDIDLRSPEDTEACKPILASYDAKIATTQREIDRLNAGTHPLSSNKAAVLPKYQMELERNKKSREIYLMAQQGSLEHNKEEFTEQVSKLNTAEREAYKQKLLKDKQTAEQEPDGTADCKIRNIDRKLEILNSI